MNAEVTRVNFLAINTPVHLFTDNGDINTRPEYEAGSRVPPIGLGLLLTYLTRLSQVAELLDVENNKIGLEKIEEEIETKHPELIGMNVLTPTLDNALRIAEHIPEDIPLVLGGPHVTAVPASTLEQFGKVHEHVMAIPGEVGHTEVALSRLVKDPDDKSIPGLWWYQNGDVRFNKSSKQEWIDFKDLPKPDEKYTPDYVDKEGKLVGCIVTSVHCPFSCTFCSGARVNKGLRSQFKSIEGVASEIEARLKNGAQRIRVMDDLFVADYHRALSIMSDRAFPNFDWIANGRANIVAKWSDGIVGQLAEVGWREAEMGVESKSRRLREQINKQLSWEEILKAVDLLGSAKIRSKLYFMLGIPSETRDETYGTIEGAKELVRKGNGLVRASMFVFRPYAGTVESERLLQKGWGESELWETELVSGGTRCHMGIVPKHKFAELDPRKYADLIAYFDEWQNRQLGS